MTHDEIVRAVWIFSGIYAVILTMIFLIDLNLFRPKDIKDADERTEHESSAP